MDKVIVTVLLIIGGVVASMAIFNSLYPVINRSSAAIVTAASKVNDRLQSQIDIIQVSNNGTEVYVWVKNVGTPTIDAIERSDVFFGPDDDFARLPYANSGPPFPYWNYQLEGGNSEWDQTVTLKVTINLSSSLSPGTYLVYMVIPNGISDRTTFGVD